MPTCRQSLALQTDAVAQAHAVTTRGTGSRSGPSTGPVQTSGRQQWRGGGGSAEHRGVTPAGEATVLAGELGLGDVE